MSETLGSQNEANEIFAFVSRYNAWQVQENNNYYAARAFQWYREEMEAWEAEQKKIAAGEYVYWPMRKPSKVENHYPFGPNIAEPELMPGWRYLAAGVSRRAYLAPSGVVYKVMKSPGSSYQGNKEEHATAERARRSGSVKGAYIPRTYIWEVPGCAVIAIEFMDGIREDKHWEAGCWGGKCLCAFPGSPRCTSRIRSELQSKLGLTDLHSHNVLWVPSQRAWAVVDLGNG